MLNLVPSTSSGPDSATFLNRDRGREEEQEGKRMIRGREEEEEGKRRDCDQ